MESKRYYSVGAYVSPFNLGTTDHIRDAWKQYLSRSVPILLEDLNINLQNPRDKRDKIIVEEGSFMGMLDTSRHFWQH